MKVLVVHNHYRQKGGEDTVFESECAMLERAGHLVIRHEKTNDDIDADDVRRGPMGRLAAKIRLFTATIWNRATYREVLLLLDQEHPDVVHCHNIFPVISPSVYDACAKRGVPVIQTLHNYRLTCLNGYLYEEHRSAICEKCLGHLPLPGVIRRCYRNSLSASFTVAAMLIVHRLIRTYRNKISCFIALTEFGREKFIAAGLPASKIVVKPNMIESISATSEHSTSEKVSQRYFLYAGRLSPEKGPDVLLAAWKLLPPLDIRLVIAGEGPLRSALEAEAAGCANPVEFLGQIQRVSLSEQMRRATALVFPSRLYETFGMSVIEANAYGTPVILSDAICVSRNVVAARNGLAFKNADPQDLARVLRSLLASPFRTAAVIPNECTESGNLKCLLDIYQSLKPSAQKTKLGNA